MKAHLNLQTAAVILYYAAVSNFHLLDFPQALVLKLSFQKQPAV